MILSPLPKLAFLDNNGRPLVGGQLFTYEAGTSTKIATYSDAGGTLNTNPVILDFRGECNVWLDPLLTYKFVLASRGDTDPPTNPIWTVDDISPLGGLTRQIIGGILWPRTPAEIAAGAIVINYYQQPGIFERYGAVGDGVTDDHLAIQAALNQSAEAGGAIARPDGKGTYSLGSSTAEIPDNGIMDITNASLVTTAVTIISFGSNTELFAAGAIITSSGASGNALAKTDNTTPAAFSIYGWPRITATTMGTAGSVGLNFTAAYKGTFEVNIEGFETQIIGGSGNVNDLPQTYYNELRSPRLRCTSGLTGIKLQRSCNGTTIINPQINGGSVATKGIWCPGSSGVSAGSTTVLGGYIEAFLDNVNTRGVLLEDVNTFTMIGTTLESANTSSNFAIGGISAATQCGFYNLGFAGGWGASTAIMSWTSTGVFNFIGGAPTNQVCLLGLTSFPTGLLNGEIRMGKTTSTGAMSFASSVSADYEGRIRNTTDGQGLLVENNSSNKSAGRSALTINRAGGPGFAIDFQDNGSAKGGIVFCTGTPESQITAVVGTLAVRNDGGANTTFYVKESGTGNTGWVAK